MAQNCRIACNILRVKPNDVPLMKSFYEETIGMAYNKAIYSNIIRHCFMFNHQEPKTGICFEECEEFAANVENSGYWKIGITLEDVDQAVKFVNNETQRDFKLGSQFEKIGFVGHIADPLGYSIEFLQHTFEKNFSKTTCVERCLLDQSKSSPPNFGQITIRCKDAKSSCNFYTEVLGMRLVSIQPSINYPFTLYFFAYTDSIPPNSQDLEAIENREWLWKQPFAQIELQHRHNLKEDFQFTTNDKQGYGCIPHAGFRIDVSSERFRIIQNKENLTEVDNVLITYDPDGYKIEVVDNNQ